MWAVWVETIVCYQALSLVLVRQVFLPAVRKGRADHENSLAIFFLRIHLVKYLNFSREVKLGAIQVGCILANEGKFNVAFEEKRDVDFSDFAPHRDSTIARVEVQSLQTESFPCEHFDGQPQTFDFFPMVLCQNYVLLSNNLNTHSAPPVQTF